MKNYSDKTITIVNCGGKFGAPLEDPQGVPSKDPLYGNADSATVAEIQRYIALMHPKFLELPINLSWKDFKPGGQFVVGHNVSPRYYNELAHEIARAHESTDGIVIIMDLETIVPTAAAMSYALHGLKKPVIFTGAALPLSHTRSDAPQNFIESVEGAARLSDRTPPFSEVLIDIYARMMRAVDTYRATVQGFYSVRTNEERKTGETERTARGLVAKYMGEQLNELSVEKKELLSKPLFANQPLTVQEFNPKLINILVLEESEFVFYEARGGFSSLAQGQFATADALIINDVDLKKSAESVEFVNKAIRSGTPIYYLNKKSAPDPTWSWAGEHMDSQQAYVKLQYVLSRTDDPVLRKKLLEANIRGERGGEIDDETEIIAEHERAREMEEPLR